MSFRRKRYQKLIAFILTLVLCLSTSAQVLATEPDSNIVTVTEDTILPEFAAGFPKINTEAITASSIELQIEANEEGLAYYVMINASDEQVLGTVTADQVKTFVAADYPGLDSWSGNIVINAAEVATQILDNLSADTNYKLYVVAEDLSGNLSEVSIIEVTTAANTPPADTTPPVFTDGYPKINDTMLSTNSLELQIETSEDSMAYYIMIYADDAQLLEPITAEEVKAFVPSQQLSSWSGNIGLNANEVATEIFNNLNENTEYKLYVVAEDIAGNLSALSMITVTTASSSGGSSGGGSSTPTSPTTDTEKPIITLNGDNEVTIFVGDTYVDQGATAIDNVDGDVTSDIVITNTVDSNTAGDYIVSYNVTDSSGNAAEEVTRIVHVLVVPQNRTISGTITLPLEELAPSGGISGYIYINSNYGYSNSRSFNIFEGFNSTGFTIQVPQDAPSTTEYRVSYGLNNYPSNYFYEGYYSTQGTTDFQAATLLNVSTGNITDIILPISAAYTISGTISLPDGITAPAGGISGYVSMEAGNNGYGTSFNIPEGANAVSYSRSLPDYIEEFKVSYHLYNNLIGYLSQGFYSLVGTTNAESAARINLNQGNLSGIDMTLLTSNSISGTIAIPAGATLVEGISGSVNVQSLNGNDYYNAYFNIPAGSNSANYFVNIPKDILSTEYRVGYSLYSNSNSLYVDGYYSTSGTTNLSGYTPVNLVQGIVTGIDMTLLTGNTISGTVSLPSGKTAPENGISGTVYVKAHNGGREYGSSFYIPAGDSTTNYSITVPVDNTIEGYRVGYWLYSDTVGYVGGYYSSQGTTDYEGASLVSINQGSITGINITILDGNIIAGTISLPAGVTAIEGIQGEVVAEPSSGGGNYYSNFSINEGTSSGSYAITVPADSTITEYHIKYYLYDNDNYVSEGYYSTTGTTNKTLATTINTNTGNVEGINLTLLTGNKISGTVSLPLGMSISEHPLYGDIIIESEDRNMSYRSYFDIPPGSSNANYSVTVPADSVSSKYYVSYSLFDQSNYVGNGYYSTSGTTNFNSATLVNVSGGNVEGVNLALLTGNKISGKVSLPDGVYAPYQGIEGQVHFQPQNGGESYSTFFYINEGSNSIGYSAALPIDATNQGYIVKYTLGGDCDENGEDHENRYSGYMDEGYYSITGTTDYNSATPVNINEGNMNNINLTLLVNNTPIQLPVINLIGPNNMTIKVGTAFIDPGAIATSAIDGDITSQIVTTGTVDTSIEGTYAIHYSVTDSSGNRAVEVIRTVHVVTSFYLTASPVVKIGENPNYNNSVGLFIGLENIQDAVGNIENPNVAGYQIEIRYDPDMVRVLDVVDEGNLGQFTVNDSESGRVLIVDAASNGTQNFNKLFFLPIELIGTALDRTFIEIDYLTISDQDLNDIVVNPIDLEFQRGKIVNGPVEGPGVTDVIAGMQYLVKMREAGFGSEQVNIINMASIVGQNELTGVIKPSIKDTISLMQYMANLRDASFSLFTGPKLQSAMTNTDGTKVTLTFDKPLSNSAALSNSEFIVDTDGIPQAITSVTLSPDFLQVILTLAAPITVNQTVSVDYFGESLTGPDGSKVADIDNYPVTNNVTISIISIDNYEADNDYTEANLITVDGNSQTHTIYPATDEDWYKFNTQAGKLYRIHTFDLVPENSSENAMDTYLYLYNQDGTTLLTKNDDDKTDIQTYDIGSRIEWVAPTSGTYYFRVIHYNYNNNQQPPLTSVGQYKISVTELDARILPTPGNFITTDRTVTWDVIPNATSYIVKIYKKGTQDDFSDGTWETWTRMNQPASGTTMSTNLDYWSSLGDGTYQIKVTAIGDGINYVNSAESEFSGIDVILSHIQLAAPTNYSTDGTTVRWDIVPEATGYKVYIYLKGNETDYSDATVLSYIPVNQPTNGGTVSIDLSSARLAPGTYQVKVSATAPGYLESDTQFSGTDITFIQLDVPNNFSTNGAIITWDKVSNATVYEVSIYKKGDLADYSDAAFIGSKIVRPNDADTAVTADFSKWELESGTYQIKVSSLGWGTNYTASEDSGFSGTDVTIIQLESPQTFSTAGSIISWNQVANAQGYVVSVYKKESQDDYSDATYVMDMASGAINTSKSIDLSEWSLDSGTYQIRVSSVAWGTSYTRSYESPFSGTDVTF